jgi:regulatory protein
MPDIDQGGAMVFALKILGLRNHSREELERKLLKKGYKVDYIMPVLEKLTLQGLLDDQVFAREYIRSRSKYKPAGKLKIKHELRIKGVSETIITQILQEVDSFELCRLAAEKKIRTLYTVPEADRKNKLERFLHNRGFAWQEIQQTLKLLFSAGSDVDNDDSAWSDQP